MRELIKSKGNIASLKELIESGVKVNPRSFVAEPEVNMPTEWEYDTRYRRKFSCEFYDAGD